MCATTIAPQIKIKQVVDTLAISEKTLPGINKFRITDKPITRVENHKALRGTWRVDSLPIRLENLLCPSYVNENNIRPVLNSALLQLEAAAVSTTKLMMAAAERIPKLVKTWTKGLWAAEKYCHGYIHIKKNNEPT